MVYVREDLGVIVFKMGLREGQDVFNGRNKG
ncbi:MAG: hypothetical protein XD50_1043 [Clostridia bacterium 41_269]|nr:MAG: hypothetical protein XD50_1043 [Clostridia bacterium 41_269]